MRASRARTVFGAWWWIFSSTPITTARFMRLVLRDIGARADVTCGIHCRDSGALCVDAVARQAAEGHRGQADDRVGVSADRRERRERGDRRNRRRAHRRGVPRRSARASSSRRASMRAARIGSPSSRAVSNGTTQQIVVNVQGDEPLISPLCIAQTARLLGVASAGDDRDVDGAARQRSGVSRSEFRQGRDRQGRLGAVLQPRADSVAARRRHAARAAGTSASTRIAPAGLQGDQRRAAVRARGGREARAAARAVARIQDHRRGRRRAAVAARRYARGPREDSPHSRARSARRE